MISSEFTADDIREILLQIDEEAVLELGPSAKLKMVIVGGSVLLLSQLSSRTFTRDIDALSYDEVLREIVARHLELNSQVSVYADRLPKKFESRLTELPLTTQTVHFLRPSNEDLAVMKLYSWRKQDQDDLLNIPMLKELNRVLLEKLIYDENEAKASSNTKLLYDQMVETYETRFLPRAVKIAKRNNIEQWLETNDEAHV